MITRTILYGCLLFAGVFLWFGIASAISLWDYTKPESFFREASLAGSFDLNDGNQEQTSYYGSVTGRYEIVYRSIPFDWVLGAKAQYDTKRAEDKTERSEYGYKIEAGTSLDKYLGDSNFFSFASLDAGFRKETGAQRSDEPFVQIDTGVGYGRLYNATVLAQAMRIVDDLIIYGVITEKPSDYGYLELARVIDLEDEYKMDYSEFKDGEYKEYKKFWYEAMEDVLKNDGVLREGNLGAIGIVRIEDILEHERFGVREHGWKIKAGISYIATDYEDGKDKDPAISVSFKLGIPYSYRLQFNEELTCTSVIGHDAEHLIKNVMSVTYEISNRIDWENSWEYKAEIPSKKGEKNRFTNEFRSSFYYYLVSRIWAVTKVSFHHLNDGIKNNGNDDITTKIELLLTYRLR